MVPAVTLHFLLAIDWIMKTTITGATEHRGHSGRSWMTWRSTRLATSSAEIGLKMNRKNTERIKINTTANTPVKFGGEPIREVESFVYLGSVVDRWGGVTDRDVTAMQEQPLSCSRTSGPQAVSV